MAHHMVLLLECLKTRLPRAVPVTPLQEEGSVESDDDDVPLCFMLTCSSSAHAQGLVSLRPSALACALSKLRTSALREPPPF